MAGHGSVAARSGAAVRARRELGQPAAATAAGLPDAALAAVRGGQLSSWAAVRVVAPLARANAEHAERLLAVLRARRRCRRASCGCWFEHYQQSPRSAREHMVDRPRLFIDSVAEANAGCARRRAPARRPGRRMPGRSAAASRR